MMPECFGERSGDRVLSRCFPRNGAAYHGLKSCLLFTWVPDENKKIDGGIRE